jgi:hypothetical protein
MNDQRVSEFHQLNHVSIYLLQLSQLKGDR